MFYIKLFFELIIVSFFFFIVYYIKSTNSEIITKKPNQSNKKIFNLIIILLLIFIGISVADKYFQNDTFFTIALGKETLQNGVHNKEVLTYHTGFKYYNVRWLFNVVIFLINNYIGFAGIYGFVITVVVLISLSLYFCIYKITSKQLLAFIITLFAMYFSYGYFAARSQIVSMLIFIIEYYSILMLLKTCKKRYLFILLLLPILIVNFHASVFPFYLILYLPFIAENIIAKFKFSKNINLVSFNLNKNIKYLYLIFLVNVLEGLISPLGFAPYTVMFNATGGVSKQIIAELQPLNYNSSTMLFFIAYILIFTGCICLIKEKIKAHTFFLFAGLGLISIISTRNFFLFFIIGAFSLAETLNIFFEENKVFDFIYTQKSSIFFKLVGILCIMVLFTPLFIKNLSMDYVDKSSYPVDATEYIINNIDLSKYTLYNGFNYGSYLEYKGIKAFMDSRSEVYEKNYNNTDILKDYSLISMTDEKQLDYKEFFNKYNINLALIKKYDDFYKAQIKDDKHNCLKTIYDDDCFLLCEVLDNGTKEKTNE